MVGRDERGLPGGDAAMTEIIILVIAGIIAALCAVYLARDGGNE